MYIKDISIENFRGIKSLEIKDFKNINVFVGKNNCGKTTILESLFLITGISNPSLTVAIDNYRNLIHTELDDFTHIFKNENYNNKITLKSNFSNNEIRELSIIPNYNSPQANTNIPIKNGQNLIIPNIPDSNIIQNKMNGLDLNFSLTNNNTAKVYDAKILFDDNIKQFIPIIDSKYHENYTIVYLLPVINYLNLYTRLNIILESNKEDLIIEHLKSIDENIENIYFGMNNMINFKIKNVDKKVPINIMGDGIIKVLSILVPIIENQLKKRKSILLIDEIENGLHYSSMTILWKAIIQFSRLSDIQIFITSHNYEILKFLQQVVNENYATDMFGESVKDNITCFSIQKSKEMDKHFSYRYDFDSFNTAIEEGNEIR